MFLKKHLYMHLTGLVYKWPFNTGTNAKNRNSNFASCFPIYIWKLLCTVPSTPITMATISTSLHFHILMISISVFIYFSLSFCRTFVSNGHIISNKTQLLSFLFRTTVSGQECSIPYQSEFSYPTAVLHFQFHQHSQVYAPTNFSV